METMNSRQSRDFPGRIFLKHKSKMTGDCCVFKLRSVFYASVLLLIINFVITLSKWLWTRRQPSGSTDYFDNVMTKFIVNNRTDSLKTDINLFFTIANGRIARSRALTGHMNFKFMCLFAY